VSAVQSCPPAPSLKKIKTMLDLIWGIKTEATFDVWTIEHFFSGVSIGAGVIIHNNKHIGGLIEKVKDGIFSTKKINWLKYKYDMFFLLFLAYVWETFEHYLETGLAGETVEYWFQGVEFWANRLIADPLMLVLGYMLVKKFPRTVWPARVFTLGWLVYHIFLVPHSMYLHEIF
jgi:hypothetical protein